MKGRYKTINDGALTILEQSHEIIRRKQDLSERSNLNGDQSEKPRDVFNQACAFIADHFSSDGFTFSKSGPHMNKKYGDLTFQVSFSSSHYNIAGKYISLKVGLGIYSAKFKKWHKQNGLRNPSNFVTGSTLEKHNLEWDLANPEERNEVIEGCIRAIKDFSPVYFERYTDIEKVVEDVANGALEICAGIASRMQFLIFFGDINIARSYAVRVMKEDPDFSRDVLSEYARYSGDEIFEVIGSNEALALASTLHYFKIPEIQRAELDNQSVVDNA